MPATEEVRERLEQQRSAARARCRGSSAVLTERGTAGERYPDSPEAVAARADRLVQRGGVSPVAAVAGVYAEALPRREADERIIGLANESQAWTFLPRGTRAASSIARISIHHDGRDLPLGTGFMVSPRLLMTNHHVLPDEAFTRRCFLEFNVQNSVDNALDMPVRFEFDPVTFFIADERLDFALIAIAPAADGRPAGDTFGWHGLSVQLGKVVLGERVNIIGHPDGRLKEIAFRGNTVAERLPDFLHYTTDTEPGSSGSPVFNDQWEVVALHHCGVAKEDEQGRALRKDGQVAQPNDPDYLVDWVSNEGVRISSILKHLAALELDADGRALLVDMGPESGLRLSAAPGALSSPLPSSGFQGVGGLRREGVESPPRPGLRGQGLGPRGRRHLVFLHGRRQHTHEPEELRRGWAAGLNHGLTRAGLATVSPTDVWFPFYADQLNAAVTGGQESLGRFEAVPGASDDLAAESAAELFAAEPASPTYERLVLEAAAREGMPLDGQVAQEGLGDLLAGPVQRALSWLAARTDIDALAIAALFEDVDRYLADSGVREQVLLSVEAFLDELPQDAEVVLITHSLGTVVGMDLVHRLRGKLSLSLLVTAGSPLGMDAVFSRLLANGPNRRAGIDTWLNAWCPTDAVAIGCPLSGRTWGEVSDVAVVNASGRAHSIEEYLAHPEVAAKVGHALTAGGS
ncbi:trypsin-like peptidase domain-containing protein [Streptomyces griseoaurantiacus]|uniref:trypsin-like peptidase domain-containing protein n=1 Tax=Streptomyces griseoaurantiacus TaxID=68213 RepID=UPI0037AB75CB